MDVDGYQKLGGSTLMLLSNMEKNHRCSSDVEFSYF